MIDIHAPHERTHTWTDFLIHIATIVVGLFIAIGLEQTVELVHRSNQRHQLEADLRTEAENNRTIIARDLRLQELEPWFEQAMNAADSAAPQQGKNSHHASLRTLHSRLRRHIHRTLLRSFRGRLDHRQGEQPRRPPSRRAGSHVRPSRAQLRSARRSAVRSSTAAAAPSAPCSTASPGSLPPLHLHTAVWILTPAQADRLAQVCLRRSHRRQGSLLPPPLVRCLRAGHPLRRNPR